MSDPKNTRNEKTEQQDEDEDFYMDGPFCVFTEAFHLKRGFCCGSGCRHCPYKQDEPQS